MRFVAPRLRWRCCWLLLLLLRIAEVKRTDRWGTQGNTAPTLPASPAKLCVSTAYLPSLLARAPCFSATGQHERAQECLHRALFALEAALHVDFSLGAAPTRPRLLYDAEQPALAVRHERAADLAVRSGHLGGLYTLQGRRHGQDVSRTAVAIARIQISKSWSVFPTSLYLPLSPLPPLLPLPLYPVARPAASVVRLRRGARRRMRSGVHTAAISGTAHTPTNALDDEAEPNEGELAQLAGLPEALTSGANRVLHVALFRHMAALSRTGCPRSVARTTSTTRQPNCLTSAPALCLISPFSYYLLVYLLPVRLLSRWPA